MLEMPGMPRNGDDDDCDDDDDEESNGMALCKFWLFHVFI